MNKYSFWKAAGIISGMIIGSGMFVIPYAVQVSGVWWSVLNAVVAFFAVLAIHLAYGEIVASASESHRLPGYVHEYLGLIPSHIERVAQVFSLNLILLIYAILAGKFLSILVSGWGEAIFSGASSDSISYYFSLILMAVCALVFSSRSARIVGSANFVMVVLLVGSILGISMFALSQPGELAIPSIGVDPFFSFSIFIFALGGLSVIADAADMFTGRSVAKPSLFRRSIIVGTTVPLFLYVFFAVSMLWVFGESISPNFLEGVEGLLGGRAMRFGALIGFLALIKSYILLGYDLKKLYELDLGVRPSLAWIIAAGVAPIIFLLGVGNVVSLMSLVGGVFVALDGLFVVLVLRAMRRKGVVQKRFLPLGSFTEVILIAIFVFSAGYEVIQNIPGINSLLRNIF